MSIECAPIHPDETEFAECARRILEMKRNYHLLAGGAITVAFFNRLAGGALAIAALVQHSRLKIEEDYYDRIAKNPNKV